MNVRYDFTNEVLVVTGGASGIGAGLCKAYADAGGTAVCADVQDELMKQLVAAYDGPGRIQAIHLNVGNSGQVKEAFAKLLSEHRQIDSLVMSAAVQPRTEIAEMTDDEWLRVMDVNLNGAFYCSRAVAPHMRQRRKGSIVTFASGLAASGWPAASAYAATKAALITFTKSLAQELLTSHVRANTIAPGVTDSPLFTGPNPPEQQEYFRKKVGAVGTVEDVVKLLLFLVSDASASLTGSLVNRELIFPSAQDFRHLSGE
ncbi:MAG: SDR family NAD(P)-dependent oxidoreductase [Bacilli bacterium]